MKKVVLFAVYLLAALLFSVNLHAQMTSISVSNVDGVNLKPGSSFTVEVWAHNVDNLWGFQFKLLFDPDILQCARVDLQRPFIGPVYTGIDNAVGYVVTDGSMDFGEWFGVTADHVLLTKITFQVKGVGYSDLQFDETITLLVNVYGDSILIGSFDNGYFVNVPLAGIGVDLVRRAAWPEHHHFVISKDEDGLQTLYAKVRNFSTVHTYLVRVEFIVNDLSFFPNGLSFFSDTITLPPGTITGTRKSTVKDISLAKSFPPGKYKVTAQVYYSANGSSWKKGIRIKRFGFAVLQ